MGYKQKLEKNTEPKLLINSNYSPHPEDISILPSEE